ncbi:hypothetical protein C2845_PM13G04960 [Panicum miliaceum]|uniref:Uncharacterized protein n=1 Tax=Panicum miliaceum TaxID=4540 RepID=A0A3L6RJ59_PANMI|nr:hypothetical protein C2845_PM13G04960 [Panicum miliaceum]
MLLWIWWMERNRVRGGEERWEAIRLAGTIAHQSDEYLAIGKEECRQPLRRLWVKPNSEFLKVNSDGVMGLSCQEQEKEDGEW